MKYILTAKSVDLKMLMGFHIVTYRPIARQRLGKHIPAEVYARNNKTSIARRRINKHAFLTTENVCFLRGPCKLAIKKCSAA
jgi:hypothetical protein